MLLHCSVESPHQKCLLRRSLPQSSAPQISVSRSIGPWSLLFDRRLGGNIAQTGEPALLALFIARPVNGRLCFVMDRFAPEAADQNGRLDEIRDQDGFDALAFGSL